MRKENKRELYKVCKARKGLIDISVTMNETYC